MSTRHLAPLIALWLLCSCNDPAADAPAPTATPAAPAPLALPPAQEGMIDLDAKQLRQTLLRAGGKGVLVNVWASWCGSCKKEVPLLRSLVDSLADQGLSLLLISADHNAQRAKAAAFLGDAGLPVPGYILAGSVDAFIRALHPRWDGGIPATFLFDGRAKLRYYWAGPVLEHEVAPVLQGFLAGEDIDGEFVPPLSKGKPR